MHVFLGLFRDASFFSVFIWGILYWLLGVFVLGPPEAGRGRRSSEFLSRPQFFPLKRQCARNYQVWGRSEFLFKRYEENRHKENRHKIVREQLDTLSKPPILVFPDWPAAENGSRPFRLHTDSSKNGFGCTSWFTLITLKTVISKTSRRFKELDAEILHICSMDHYEKSEDFFFFTFLLFSPFFGVPRFFWTNALHSDPSNSKIRQKVKKPNPSDFALWPMERLCKNSGSNSLKRREVFRVCAMNLAVPRCNRKLLDLSMKMAFWDLLWREHENSSTSWSRFTTKICGILPWIMRRQTVFEKMKKKAS